MSINISELIWTVICFFVLLVVLKKLLFDPLVSFMAARDARIQDGLNAGRTAQQQLDAAAQARSDAQRLIDRGALRGNERGELDLSPDMLRTLIVCQRMVDQAKET